MSKLRGSRKSEVGSRKYDAVEDPGPNSEFRIPNFLLALVAAVLLLGGCGDPDVLPPGSGSDHTTTQPADGEKLFEYAVENLNRLPEFGPNQGVLKQIAEGLNAWNAHEKPRVKWEMDPMIATLPNGLQQAGLFALLKRTNFDIDDARFLREVVWLRDIATFVGSRPYDEHEEAARLFYHQEPAAALSEKQKAARLSDDRFQAARLFDWTVRNIQLEPNQRQRAPRHPWEVLLLGRGTAVERAWVFALLARQQRLDVVLLATPDRQNDGGYTLWAAAHLDQGHLYLYDPELGLCVPGPDGRGVATLSQAAENEAILRRLGTAKRAYPVQAADLKGVMALVEADLPYLSRRMKLVESRLSHDGKMVLSVAAAALAERLAKCAHLEQTRIWLWPYQIAALRIDMESLGARQLDRDLSPFDLKERKTQLQVAVEPEQEGGVGDNQFFIHDKVSYPLWRARLRHLQGRLGKPARASGAGGRLEPSGPGADNRDNTPPPTDAPPPTEIDETDNAIAHYLEARSTSNVDEGEQEQLENEKKPKQTRWEEEVAKSVEAVRKEQRELATYWLGLVCYEQRHYDVAIYYFQQSLNDWPQGRFAGGAVYNQARAYEALGQTAKAIALYEDQRVSMPEGSRLRAERLKSPAGAADATRPTSKSAEATKSAAAKPAEPKPQAEGPKAKATKPAGAKPAGAKPAGATPEPVPR